MSLPPFSPRRIREIQAGTRNRDGTLKVSVKELREKQDAKTKAIREAIFGTPKEVKRTTKQKAKAAAIKWFSEWIRLRDAGPDGRAKCITCPRIAHWRTMDAGHFITCGKEATRFDEHNVSCQCKGCNKWQGGKFFEHEKAVDVKFGDGTAQRIKDKAARDCKRTAQDFQFIADAYRSRVDLIRQTEPERYG